MKASKQANSKPSLPDLYKTAPASYLEGLEFIGRMLATGNLDPNSNDFLDQMDHLLDTYHLVYVVWKEPYRVVYQLDGQLVATCDIQRPN